MMHGNIVPLIIDNVHGPYWKSYGWVEKYLDLYILFEVSAFRFKYFLWVQQKYLDLPQILSKTEENILDNRQYFPNDFNCKLIHKDYLQCCSLITNLKNI